MITINSDGQSKFLGLHARGEGGRSTEHCAALTAQNFGDEDSLEVHANALFHIPPSFPLSKQPTTHNPHQRHGVL